MSLFHAFASLRSSRPSPRQPRERALVASVEWVDRDDRGRIEGVSIDADLSGYFWDASRVRLAGRPSSARVRRIRLNSRSRQPLLGPWVRLPGDVREGDRLEVPAVRRPTAASGGPVG